MGDRKPRARRPVVPVIAPARGRQDGALELRITYSSPFQLLDATWDSPEEEILAEADELLAADGRTRMQEWEHPPGLASEWITQAR